MWDVALETATPLYRAGGGVTLTSWSPDERNVFAATPSGLFRFYQYIANLLPFNGVRGIGMRALNNH